MSVTSLVVGFCIEEGLFKPTVQKYRERVKVST